MFSQLVACVLLACVLVSDASPAIVNESPVKLPIVRRLNLTGTTLAKADQTRARFLKSRSQLPKSEFDAARARKNAASAVGVGVTNGVVDYTAEAGALTIISKFFAHFKFTSRLVSETRRRPST